MSNNTRSRVLRRVALAAILVCVVAACSDTNKKNRDSATPADAAATVNAETTAEAAAVAARDAAERADAQARSALAAAEKAQVEATTARSAAERAERAAVAAKDTADAVFDNPGGGLTIVQALPTWPSGLMQAAIYRQLLLELGYAVANPLAGPMDPDEFYETLANGGVDFWAHGWLPAHNGQWTRTLDNGSLIGNHIEIVGIALTGGGVEGLLTTRGIVQEYAIESLGDINDTPTLVDLYDAHDSVPGDGRVQILTCPETWNCAHVASETIELNGWDNLQAVHDDYDSMFAAALTKMTAGEPVIIYAWAPGTYFAELIDRNKAIWLSVGDASNVIDGTTLSGYDYDDLPPANVAPEHCAGDPCYTGWPSSDIRVVANSNFLDTNPAALSLFQTVVIDPFDVAVQNLRYSRGEDTPFDVDQHAAEWIEENRVQVDAWIQHARDVAR